MFELMLTMLERLGIIVTIAFILTRFRFFRQMIHQEDITWKQQVSAIIFFGFFGIIGTYSGLAYSTDSLQFDRITYDLTQDEALANSRVIGVIIAGILGGYKVGIGAGLIAGVHRFSLGGFTDLACGLSAIIAGIIAGYFHTRNKHITLTSAFIICALAEAFQMLIILLMARPFSQALTLVENIGIPMIIANGIGSALFLLIIRNLVGEEEKAGALQAQKALRLAELTLIYLRKGLNVESAKETCAIIYREVDASAVSITDKEKILAHIGSASDHHKELLPIQTDVTRKVIQRGKLVVAGHKEIHCTVRECPLNAVVIAPLKQRGEVIGTLKFYFKTEREITNVVIQLIKGLSSLLSNQLDMAESDRAYQLAKEAEIKSLQAQISPHFLFNTLNIIVSLIRIDQNKARQLLIALSHFLRQNLSGTTMKWTTLEAELRHVRAYLSIEEARFVDKLIVSYSIDDHLLLTKIPPLTLQPIVENAVKHGIREKHSDCRILISIKKTGKSTVVSVTDNGKGIDEIELKKLGKRFIPSEESTGIGLYNVNRRLVMMLGEKSRLTIESEGGKGTKVSFTI
ncbi:sensor histidine kinase [Litchfieldia salsa]|uniref:histidine kinase n=1 Tax=Litchfieldia salsa TaxID=930152 RepID=A0A1H0RUN7_9BACI|nr:sensor histidine kinase [Litchfieldia salsa]SDP33115.1 two-component system, LytT family, sensor histidine kinase LytS [Litchfieldia salsa]